MCRGCMHCSPLELLQYDMPADLSVGSILSAWLAERFKALQKWALIFAEPWAGGLKISVFSKISAWYITRLAARRAGRHSSVALAW